MQPQQTQHTNLIHTTQKIKVTIANHQPKNFSNIKELTGLNILPPRKLPDRIVTSKNTKQNNKTKNKQPTQKQNNKETQSK